MLASNRLFNYSWSVRDVVDLFDRYPEWVNSALNQALAEDDHARWQWVLGLYLDQRISLGKAAEMLDMHSLELRERFLQLGIPLRLGPADLAEARAEVDSVRRWFDTTPQEPSV